MPVLPRRFFNSGAESYADAAPRSFQFARKSATLFDAIFSACRHAACPFDFADAPCPYVHRHFPRASLYHLAHHGVRSCRRAIFRHTRRYATPLLFYHFLPTIIAAQPHEADGR